jgi:hypothetical protein
LFARPEPPQRNTEEDEEASFVNERE